MVANLEEEAKEMKIQIERLELSTNPEVKNIFERKRICTICWYKSLHITVLFLAILTFYIFARYEWGQIPSFIGALFYITCPGIIALLNGGTLAFLCSAPLIPLGLYLTNRAIGEPKFRIPLCVFWSTLALTHVPSLLLYTIAWFIYLAFIIRKNNWLSIISTALTTGIGFGSTPNLSSQGGEPLLLILPHSYIKLAPPLERGVLGGRAKIGGICGE